VVGLARREEEASKGAVLEKETLGEQTLEKKRACSGWGRRNHPRLEYYYYSTEQTNN